MSHLNCPICHKLTASAFKPFCCKRCADVDLNRWLGEVYTVATDEQPETQAEPKAGD